MLALFVIRRFPAEIIRCSLYVHLFNEGVKWLELGLVFWISDLVSFKLTTKGKRSFSDKELI